jgi:hypothetical protein
MTDGPASLPRQGVDSLAWVKDFYDQTSTCWVPNTDWASCRPRAAWQYVVKLVPAGPRPAAS